MIKAPGSMWETKRNKCWLKLKPDYLHHLDIDAVIIAAWHGAGRRGAGPDGELLSEFLMALAVPQGPGRDMRFCSFCRCVCDQGRIS